jgi:hypothetical protein
MFADLRALKAAKDNHKQEPMEKRHPISHTMLRTLEKIDKLDLSIFGLGFDKSAASKKVAIKQQKFYSNVKSCIPYFSGNLSDPIVNWLIELDIMKRVNENGMVKICMSPRYGSR